MVIHASVFKKNGISNTTHPMNIHPWRDNAEGTHVAAVIDEGEGLRYRDICLGIEALLVKNYKLLSIVNHS